MKMSDFDNISKAIQKKFFRTKEKVLETLGKADKTKDGDFDSLANTFHEQHATANKLLRAFRNYSAQVKAMSVASKNMHQAVSDAYEPNWDGAENFVVQTEQLNKIWDDHFAKVSETIQFHIVSYVSKFPELKNKIAKRGRKLLDYDRARHKLDALEKSKKRDEYKITTATRELNAAQTIYETINNELFEELPVLYNSRIPLLSNYFSLFLRTEASFEDDLTKIKRQMAELTAGLLKEQNLIASKSSMGTLRAKTLPRREPPKMAAPVEKKGRYSPQLGGSRANESRNLNKGATLPPKPPSPKFSSFSYQPPPPQEPAPLPPATSPVYSTIGQSKSQSSPPPQKPPQPQFGYISPQSSPLQNSAQINPQTSSSSSLPPPIPPPPSAFVNHEVSPSSSPPLDQNQVRSLISYVPELTPLSGHSPQPVDEPGNPFDSDLKEESEKATKELSKGIANVTTGLSEGLKEVEKKVGDVGKEVVDGGAHVAAKVEGGVAKCAEGVAKGVEGVAKGGAQVTSQVINAGQNIAAKTSEKTEAVLNDVSKKSEAGIEKVKEVSGDAGKTITENIDLAAHKVASNRLFGGVVGLAGGKVEVKVGEMGEIILPSNRYLYKVQATHSYLASDTDEMTLDSGDVIYVLPIDNKEFEDEGWALGLKQKNGSRGMFPVNFTRRIDQ